MSSFCYDARHRSIIAVFDEKGLSLPVTEQSYRELHDYIAQDVCAMGLMATQGKQEGSMRYYQGKPVHLIDREGRHLGAVIARKHDTEEGTADLIFWDPILLGPQPARLVSYRSVARNTLEGEAPWTWHHPEDEG